MSWERRTPRADRSGHDAPYDSREQSAGIRDRSVGSDPSYEVASHRTRVVEVRPPSPFRLPLRGSFDGTARVRGRYVLRYMSVGGAGVVVAASQPARDRVCLRAEPAPAAEPAGPAGPASPTGSANSAAAAEPASAEHLEKAISRFRFALGVDDDLSDFYARFKDDRLLGPMLRRHPDLRPARLITPWQAFAWAVVGQLIEGSRAAGISRAIVRRYGPRGPGGLIDAPAPAAIASLAPAELEALDLSAGRAAALVRVAGDIAAGRLDPGRPESDGRLLTYRQIGPWTVQNLALYGRGEHDSLPAGDLDYLKIVGGLAGLGRRAEIDEVEAFFEPYRPYRGLAGVFTRACARRAARTYA